jgi:small basic protein
LWLRVVAVVVKIVVVGVVLEVTVPEQASQLLLELITLLQLDRVVMVKLFLVRTEHKVDHLQ